MRWWFLFPSPHVCLVHRPCPVTQVLPQRTQAGPRHPPVRTSQQEESDAERAREGIAPERGWATPVTEGTRWAPATEGSFLGTVRRAPRTVKLRTLGSRCPEISPNNCWGAGRGWRGSCARSPALSCQTRREGRSETRDKIPSQKAFDKLQKAATFQPAPPLPVSQLETRLPQKELSNFFLAVERITSVLISTLKCWVFELSGNNFNLYLTSNKVSAKPRGRIMRMKF